VIEVRIPGDEVIDYLRAQGAERTDAAPTFPGGGRHQNNIITYVKVIEADEWWSSERPIILDAKTGTVWKGTDRVNALALVDWSKVSQMPMFTVQVEHPQGG
jgi:hypothetical protein